MSQTDFETRILKAVSQPDYKPLTLKALGRFMGVDADAYPEFRSTAKWLIKDGQLEIAKDKRLSKPNTKGTVTGIYRRNAKGFGFVKPHGTTERTDQIFIPPDAGRDASSGDEVAVRIVKKPKGPGMNPEGRIVQVLARASGAFVGTYFEQSGAGFVRIDGTTFNDPIYVGDPGAKGAKPGDKVALEMVRYPSPYVDGEGVITEILGPRGAPGVDTLAVIRALNIPDVFDDVVLDEARRQAKLFKQDEIGERLDLREVLTVTIDPATARDFDDAITLERDERGYWSLGVHIADVSHFVESGSELDQSAKRRGTSVYLPDRVIPMLPEIISNSLASLQAGHVRYTVSALLEFNAEGVRTGMSFARSAIRVDHRFSYEEAFAVMKAPDEAHEGVTPEVAKMVSQMLELAMIMRRRRFDRGALELSMPEVEIDLGDQGQVVGAHLASHDESHQVIEEFMLAANEAVASHLTANHVGFLRRGHADPDPLKLREFAEFVGSLGIKIDKPQSRFELQRVLSETTGKPEEHAVHYGLLRSLKQAVYTPEPEGHFALASEDYCHFTSPIRRYPDLQVHRQLTTLIAGKKPKSNHDELVVLAEHCTKTERRAETAERELIKIKLLTYLETRIGETFQAVVIGVEDFGFFGRLVELPVEGLIHITNLDDDYYYLESETHTLIGRRGGRRYRLGDKVEVRIAHIDVDRRILDLALVKPDAPPIEAGAEPMRPRAPRPVPRGPKKPARKGVANPLKGDDKKKKRRKR
ncbi:ribonuclease R [Singulisphaera sp. PoT]|uniref:ribonuclease R n=1 Tax=Singulisphaera sp. PoT TaxID=3411797 RepID=UPI003BF50865